MPNTSGSTKKCNTENTTSPQKNTSAKSSSSNGRKARKRKRCEVMQCYDTDWEEELAGCNMQDAVDIERKLRNVARTNSLSDDEMRKLLQKFVKNEHVLALVTIQSEDELAREKLVVAERAVIITDTPSIPKLTRAKARELNKTPGITLPSLSDSSEIATLIKDDLHSDEDDEEYTFKEEDFISDDDPNTTASDLDSNPRTPQNTLTHNEESPVKFTPDGCFKVPLERRNAQEDFRIATRTRSKLCLQQTTIEDIQSEFVPPDVEQFDLDIAAIDDDWLQFLNDFAKPLSNTIVGDDDDPINDPEYVGADTIPVDAEELRDVNISKKELTELVAELFEGLISEQDSLETIELDTPQKFLNNNNNSELPQPQTNEQPQSIMHSQYGMDSQMATPHDTTMHTQMDYSFRPDVMSTPSTLATSRDYTATLPLAVTVDSPQAANTGKTYTLLGEKEPELIAVPVPGQPNCYQIAKVVPADYIQAYANSPEKPYAMPYDKPPEVAVVREEQPANALEKHRLERAKYSYDSQFTWEYISIKRNVFAEYVDRFEKLRHLPVSPAKTGTDLIVAPAVANGGMYDYQYQMLQQQLCIHVQMLTQTYLQTYSHPNYWKFAPKAKTLLNELQQKAVEHPPFNAYNLNGALDLVNKWEQELSVDNAENQQMMEFISREINLTNKNTRQIPRFCPRIMDVMLNSCVFMYPQYLPRIPFVSKVCSYQSFAPYESQLIAMGLQKHMQRIADGHLRVSKKASPLLTACKALCEDTVFGKSKRRVWDHIRQLRKDIHYNPVKFYFDHNRAPPVENILYTFEDSVVLPPKERFDFLPLAFQKYLIKQNKEAEKQKKKNARQIKAAAKKTTASSNACTSYVEFVREAVGDDILLPDTFVEAVQPHGSITEQSAVDKTSPAIIQASQKHRTTLNSSSPNKQPNTLVVNLNYIFGGGDSLSLPNTLPYNSNLSYGDGNQTNALTYGDACQLDSLQIHEISNTTNATATRTTQSTQKKLTDFFAIAKGNGNGSQGGAEKPKRKKRPKNVLRRFHILSRKYEQLQQRLRLRKRKIHINQRPKRLLRKRHYQRQTCGKLLQFLLRQRVDDRQRYAHVPNVQFVYRRFRALELYTDLLGKLKMEVRNGNGNATTSGSRPHKKSNRTEENFRQMLLPCSAQEVNLRDSTIAFQFYEKVEEVFMASKRPEKFREFSKILTEFDPQKDKSSDLYYSAEKLFLPDHPELAEAFLIFFLPDEAAEIGRFFEHFIATNMQTFNEKLRTYFYKQPAQLRKIFSCLEDLSEKPDLTMEEIESKIVPLLKGNKFLIEWFKQIFMESPPPKSLMPSAEHVNLKQVHKNRDGEIIEQINEMPDAPHTEPTDCGLKYINGRIFTGHKMTLPVKLSFMADHLHEQPNDESEAMEFAPITTCVHGINKHGHETNKLSFGRAHEEPERSDDDDTAKLIIDSTGDSSTSPNSIAACNELTLRSHAMRLNPNFYNSAYYSNLNASTHGNARKSSAHHNHHHPHAHNNNNNTNHNDDGKSSPRKAASSSPNINVTTSPLSTVYVNDSSSSSHGGGGQQRRKASPVKKLKSPTAGTATARQRANVQPMVVIHERNAAIACAKRLKTLVEDEPNESSESDCKERVPIVARSKNSLSGATRASLKRENLDDLEFLPVNAEVRRYSSMSSGSTTRNSLSLSIEDEFKVSISQPAEDVAAPVACETTATTPVSPAPVAAAPSGGPKEPVPWSREEDKVVLIEMNFGSGSLEERYNSVANKLPTRTHDEVLERYAFLIDYMKTLGR